MKTIENGQAIKIKGWKRISEVAMVQDMGVQDDYKEYVTDEDRVFASPRTLMLCSDKRFYEEEERRYANPVEVEDGEIVVLKSNGRQYKVKNMAGGNRWEYYSDILHFELVR